VYELVDHRELPISVDFPDRRWRISVERSRPTPETAPRLEPLRPVDVAHITSEAIGRVRATMLSTDDVTLRIAVDDHHALRHATVTAPEDHGDDRAGG
jgi:hypothetical protein